MSMIIKETDQFRLDNMEKLHVFLTERFINKPKPEPNKFKKYFAYFALNHDKIQVKQREASSMMRKEGALERTSSLYHRKVLMNDIHCYREEQIAFDQLKTEIDGLFQKP